MQSIEPSRGSGGMPPRKILKKLLYEIEFCSNFDYKPSRGSGGMPPRKILKKLLYEIEFCSNFDYN